MMRRAWWLGCGLAVIVVSGCSTVRITSEPSPADVRQYGVVRGNTPYEVKLFSLSAPVTFEVTKSGYESQTVVLQPSGSKLRHVELEKIIPKVEISSKPRGAEVVDEEGRMVGQTPLTVTVTQPEQTYTLSKMSYPSRMITVTPETPTPMMVDLGSQIPGMVLYELVVSRDGLELRSEAVFADRDVIERSPAVKAVRRLTDFAQTRWVSDITLFPDNSRIMMEVLDQEPDSRGQPTRFSNLWSRELTQDGRLQRWTDGYYFDESPGFAASGDHLYFSSTRSGKVSVFRMSTGGQRGLGLVTTGATLDRYPRLSPDGATLVWTAYVPGTVLPQLWSMSLSERGLQVGLPMQLREGAKAQWSPDGSLLLYSVLDRNINKWKIWTMRPDGSDPTQITTGSDSNDIEPQWFPDGQRIIFASDRGVADGKPNFDIWIAKADGSDFEQLTTNGSRDDKPVISADGKTVFFRSNRGLKWDIWTMEIVGR